MSVFLHLISTCKFKLILAIFKLVPGSCRLLIICSLWCFFMHSYASIILFLWFYLHNRYWIELTKEHAHFVALVDNLYEHQEAQCSTYRSEVVSKLAKAAFCHRCCSIFTRKQSWKIQVWITWSTEFALEEEQRTILTFEGRHGIFWRAITLFDINLESNPSFIQLYAI